MANASQLYLLSDHIKLSLLERQRAISLNLEPSSQDSHISRSLDSLREGIETLEQSSNSADHATSLRTQYDDLTSQFRGFPSKTSTSLSSAITEPNSTSLRPDFDAAKTRPQTRAPPVSSSSSSSLRKATSPSPTPAKNVRFRDNSPPPDAQETANGAALFPYRDTPDEAYNDGPAAPDHRDLDNRQIHSYHQTVLAEQDDQLDRLGASIGRQRDLSIQIGGELDDQVEMLGEVDGHMDRTHGRLEGARAQLRTVARKARDNKLVTVIIVLVVVLVLLIIVFKS